MQSYNVPTSGFGFHSSIVQKTTLMKGKENELNAPTCLQLGKQKPTMEKLAPRDTPKSRLPVFSKAREPIDFQKLHQSWENQFQKGKAVKKKSCTRPQPFNFSQKRDRSQVTADTGQSVNFQVALKSLKLTLQPWLVFSLMLGYQLLLLVNLAWLRGCP